MRAFVTGATGFLGSHLVRTLVEAGHEVHILRRSTSRLDAIAGLPVTHHLGDLSQPEALASLLQGVDWVFHTAAVADYWRQSKEKLYSVNVDATRMLLQAAQQGGVGRFIFTSSAAAIGWRHDRHAANEHTYFNVSPRLSPYGHSKFLGGSRGAAGGAAGRCQRLSSIQGSSWGRAT
ncbi:MAG: NAD-dependent epimerase/dehydratase family protein [Anaerolineae bacterium]|nr:NAD-dependent epimerase/dehydratase family protein [Anaerolineae bacterium]